VACAARLGIADELAAGPRSCGELAQSTGTSPFHLARLMRALCGLGIFKESAAGFHLTPASQWLRHGVEGSLRPFALFQGEEMYRAFEHLHQTIRSGASGWNEAFGSSIWGYLADHPERGSVFDSMMRQNHAADLPEIVASFDFSAARTIVDIGGGDGSVLREILRRNPNATGVLFEAADVVARARNDEAWNDLRTRCRFESGSFFESVPSGGDIYILRHILHDWTDERCRQILERCREAMHAGSTLLIIETPLEPGRGAAIWSDLNLMILGGQERTVEEYQQLLSAAGFGRLCVAPNGGRVATLEAHVISET
jgi:hypothetical protein